MGSRTHHNGDSGDGVRPLLLAVALERVLRLLPPAAESAPVVGSHSLKLRDACHTQIAEEVTSAHGHDPLAAVAELQHSVGVKMVVVAAVSIHY